MIVKLGKSTMGLFTLVAFSTYMRMQENTQLNTIDLAAPVADSPAGFNSYVIILAGGEDQTTKTGGHDETILLDDSRMQYLGPLLQRLVKLRLEGSADAEGDGATKLWDFSARAYLETWRKAITQLGLGELYEHHTRRGTEESAATT